MKPAKALAGENLFPARSPVPGRGLHFSHRQAVAAMLLVTLMWSMAGIVSRQLVSAASFEVTFWRSASNAVALGLLLVWRDGAAALKQRLLTADRWFWASALCWCVMFTAFMLAMTLTTVANVLVTMALGPLFTALLARMALHQRLPARTWAAIALAGLGIAWMYGSEVAGGSAQDALGTVIALCVPIAGASMWTLLQHHARRHAGSQWKSGSVSELVPAQSSEPAPSKAAPPEPAPDMTPAVLVGALASALLTLPLAWPFQAIAQDIGWLAFLGVFQLAVPCMLAVAAGKVLKAPEAALLGLLEVLFGVAWTWIGGAETPRLAVLGGGGLVLLALAGNEVLALREKSPA